MTGDPEPGHLTGTTDKDDNLIWFTEACLRNALRLETYLQDAERAGDAELADFFRRAQAASRKGAEQGKRLLRARLGGERRSAGLRCGCRGSSWRAPVGLGALGRGATLPEVRNPRRTRPGGSRPAGWRRSPAAAAR
jgi:hypothetical protein